MKKMGWLRLYRELLQTFLYGDTIINFTTAQKKILIYLLLNPGSTRISLNLVDIKGRIMCLLKQSADKHLPFSIYLFKKLFAIKQVRKKAPTTPHPLKKQTEDIIVVLTSYLAQATC